MANSKRLFGVVRRKLLSRSPSSITTIRSSIPETTKEHIAAIKIQAYFRGHLVKNIYIFSGHYKTLFLEKLITIASAVGKESV